MELMEDFDETTDLMAPRGGGVAGFARCIVLALAIAAMILLFGCRL